MITDDSSPMEAELLQLKACRLDASLLNRLEACACGNWLQPCASEVALEDRLREDHQPAALSPMCFARLELALADTPFPAAEKIVPFPADTTLAETRHSSRPWWASAAAVALLGASTALFYPFKSADPSIPVAQPHSAAPPALVQSPTRSSLSPAGFNRVLSEARDEGVIWKKANETPHRVVKVVYEDLTTLKDEKGRTYQVKQPRVEYILVPTQPH